MIARRQDTVGQCCLEGSSNDNQSGIVVVLVAMTAAVFLSAIAALAYWGQLRSVQQELQNAADSAALGAAAVLREGGLEGKNTIRGAGDIVEAGISSNLTDGDAQHEIQVIPDPGQNRDIVKVRLQYDYQSPFALFGVKPRQLEAAAHASVSSWSVGEDGWPVVIFLVHAAASMGDAVRGSDRSLWDVTVSVVREFVQSQLPIRPGVVVYSDLRQAGEGGFSRGGYFVFGLDKQEAGGGSVAAPQGPPQIDTENVEAKKAIVSWPKDGPAGVVAALGKRKKPDGLTNIHHALGIAFARLSDRQRYPLGASRRVVLLSNERINYLVMDNDDVDCKFSKIKLWPDRPFWFKCTVKRKGMGTGIEGDRAVVVDLADRLREAGIALHVMQMEPAPWDEVLIKDGVKGQVYKLFSELKAYAKRLIKDPHDDRLLLLRKHGYQPKAGFLKRLAGAAGDVRGDDKAYFTRVDTSADTSGLSGVLAKHSCRFDPLEGDAAGAVEVTTPAKKIVRFVFFRDPQTGSERALGRSSGDEAAEAFRIVAGRTAEISLSGAACKRLGVSGEHLVVRWGKPQLIAAPKVHSQAAGELRTGSVE